jgi:ribosomal protein S8
MKKYVCLVTLILLTSCQITETLTINNDGSGKIIQEVLRDEQSYQLLVGEDYSKEEEYKDTTYVFKEVIAKNQETFSRLTKFEKEVFEKFNPVTVHIKKSSIEKHFKTTFTQKFKVVEEVADLLKTENYVSDIIHNYALAAEEHYFSVHYSYDGKIFKRMVKITDPERLKLEQARVEANKKHYASVKLVENFVLKYQFPSKIKSVSNPNAQISPDQKSLQIDFKITDCLQNPELTSIEVIFE